MLKDVWGFVVLAVCAWTRREHGYGEGLGLAGHDGGGSGQLEGNWTLFPQGSSSSLPSSTSGCAGELVEKFFWAVA